MENYYNFHPNLRQTIFKDRKTMWLHHVKKFMEVINAYLKLK